MASSWAVLPWNARWVLQICTDFSMYCQLFLLYVDDCLELTKILHEDEVYHIELLSTYQKLAAYEHSLKTFLET